MDGIKVEFCETEEKCVRNLVITYQLARTNGAETFQSQLGKDVL